MLAVEWGKSTSWDCKFPDAPAPFNNWFPATMFERRAVSLTTEPIAGPVIATEVPSGEESRNISLSFIDDHKSTLFNWFVDWYADMTNGGVSIATVTEACRTFYLAKLDNTLTLTKLEVLLVFPTGELRESGTSNPTSEHKSFVVNFVVAGKQGGARTGNSSPDNTGTSVVTP